MASKLFISEFASAAQGFLAPQTVDGQTDQVVDYSGGAARSAALQVTTQFVRVVSDSPCSIAVGDDTVVATISNFYLPANVPAYIGVLPGQYISAITNS